MDFIEMTCSDRYRHKSEYALIERALDHDTDLCRRYDESCSVKAICEGQQEHQFLCELPSHPFRRAPPANGLDDLAETLRSRRLIVFARRP